MIEVLAFWGVYLAITGGMFATGIYLVRKALAVAVR